MVKLSIAKMRQSNIINLHRSPEATPETTEEEEGAAKVILIYIYISSGLRETAPVLSSFLLFWE